MINSEKITEAAIGVGAGPLALEAGVGLAEEWINRGVCADKKVVAVECGFVWWLDADTAIIGVQDLLTEENSQIVGNEWKTTKEAGKWWDEDQWLEEITEGHQIAVYALALMHATYYEANGATFKPAVKEPVVRVRAVSKSVPPVLWPRGNDLVKFTPERLERTKNALVNKAAAIRAMKRTALVPWQLPGIWCENKFRRKCEWLEECREGKYPVGIGLFDSSDPAAAAALGHIDQSNPELVVLGASAYGAASECLEKFRRNALAEGNEESLALSTGSVFHASVAEYYRQLREEQNS